MLLSPKEQIGNVLLFSVKGDYISTLVTGLSEMNN